MSLACPSRVCTARPLVECKRPGQPAHHQQPGAGASAARIAGIGGTGAPRVGDEYRGLITVSANTPFQLSLQFNHGPSFRISNLVVEMRTSYCVRLSAIPATRHPAAIEPAYSRRLATFANEAGVFCLIAYLLSCRPSVCSPSSSTLSPSSSQLYFFSGGAGSQVLNMIAKATPIAAPNKCDS